MYNNPGQISWQPQPSTVNLILQSILVGVGSHCRLAIRQIKLFTIFPCITQIQMVKEVYYLYLSMEKMGISIQRSVGQKEF